MALTIKAGETVKLGIEYTDTNGNKTMTWPTDAPPQWSDTTPAADTLTAEPDGQGATAVGTPVGGDDTIHVALTAGGVPFAADVALTVTPAAPPSPPPPPPPPPAPVLQSIAIVPVPPTP